MHARPNASFLASRTGFGAWWRTGLGLLLAVSLRGAEPARPIRIGVEGMNSGMLSFVDAQGRPSGFSADLIRAMAREGDLDVELVPDSWSRLLAAFNAGRIDVLANVTVTEDRLATMDFSIPHASIHGVAYVRENQDPPRHSSELVGRRIATVSGTLESQHALRHKGWGGTVVQYHSFEATFRAVQSGECDVALLTRRFPAAFLSERGVHGDFLDDVTYPHHFAVHKGDAATLARLNSALARVLHDGTFDRIYDRWVGPTEPHQIRMADLRPYFLPAALVLAAVIAVLIWQRRVISQRAVQAARLAEAEERYRGLVESAFDGSVIHQDGLVQSANPAFARMFGYAPEELVGRKISALMPTAAATRASENPWATAQSTVQAVGVRPDGTRITVELASKACTHGGKPALITVVRDITQRVQAEATLRESETLFRGVFAASPIPIQLCDATDGRLIAVNSVSLELFGYTRDEVIGRTSEELGIWADDGQRQEFLRRVRTEKLVQGLEATLREKNGAERIMLCTGALITIAGQPRILVSEVEITAVRQAEAERAQIQTRLFQGQKYEALGTLAGGVAHDFNNILTGVINYATLAEADCPPTHPQVKAFLGEVLFCANRAKELVRQILLFSRSEASERGPLLLQHVVKDSLSLLRSTIPTSVEIRPNLAATAPVVLANATQIHQVVMNLAINAAHAMQEKGGVLTIQLRPRQVTAALVGELPDLSPGPHVCLEVTDTGCGMEPAVVARIFEPFFTTKQKGEGTGLGLAVVHSVMRSHQGAIRVRSKPGLGTTFELFFPVHGVTASAGSAAAPELPRANGQKIMIVDDEASIGRSLKLLLERIGYRVVFHRDPEQARAEFSAAPDDFALVLTDFQMPGMTGLDLAERLRSLRPTVPIFIASGYSGTVTSEKMHALGINRILTKPIEISELASALAETLSPDLNPAGRS